MDDAINSKTIKIEFRLGDVIQFYSKKNDLNNFDFMGDYKIIAAKFYKFDLFSIGQGVTGGTYIVSEVKFGGTNNTFKRNEYPLEYHDSIKKCYNTTNWNQPKWRTSYFKYSGINIPGETIKNIDGPIASFYSNTGSGYYYSVNRKEGPQTVFTLESTLNKKFIMLFDIQLYYYFKCHK